MDTIKRKKTAAFDITVIMPALNEEDNIVSAINNTLNAFTDFNLKAEIVVVNDGSTDKTQDLANDMIKKDDHVRIIKHDKPQGIGVSFWDGVDNALGNAVILLPGDNENDPWEILRYFNLLNHVDIVIPFVFNKEVRSLFRNALSFVYRFVINSTFIVNLNYTNGTVLYRKTILKKLDHRSDSFFFQTDILVRSIKKGYLFAEVPYRLGLRKHGTSRAVSFPSCFKVAGGYLRLVKDYYFKKSEKAKTTFPEDSMTAIRRCDDENGLCSAKGGLSNANR
jgi:glycosyltransferase involved in cell wall biosynthesis